MNNWTIIDNLKLELKSGRIRNSYLIQCTCGYKRTIHVSDWKHLENGTISPKGNLNYKCFTCLMNEDRNNKLKKCNIENAFKILHRANQNGSIKINREFNLTLTESSKLYKSNCYYCGKIPSNKIKLNTGNVYKYSGIDRIDSLKGYTINNVRPCCIECNKAKSNMSEESFYQLAINITALRLQRLSAQAEYTQVSGNGENRIYTYKNING